MDEQKMKILCTIKGVSLAILDPMNYGVGKVVWVTRKQKDGSKTKSQQMNSAHYWGSINDAVRDLATVVANNEAKDLKSWLVEYKKTTRKLESLLTESKE